MMTTTKHDDARLAKAIYGEDSEEYKSFAAAVDDCECDNTHYQNQTVCMPCYNAGIRFDTAYWPDHLKTHNTKENAK